MKLVTLSLIVLTISCNSSESFHKKESIIKSLSVNNTELDLILGPVSKSVCKIETAPNYEPRAADGTTKFIADNTLCEKLVCIKEYVETPFELVNPDKVKFGCESSVSDKDYEVTLGWAADDASTVYMDGEDLWKTDSWYQFHEKTITLKGGCHTLAIHAVDVHRVISGILAYMKVDGEVVWKSGDGNEFLKAFGPQMPAGNWKDLDYDESAWKSSETCSDPSPWGDRHSSITNQGSKWIWWSSNCRNLTQAFFRLSFSLNPPTKILINKEELCKAQ